MSDKKKSERVKERSTPYEEKETDFSGLEFDRYEIIEGIRYDLTPAPTVTQHRTCHSTGTILYAPTDVYFNEENQFQPDLVYILHENASIIKEERIEGAPDLVLEILSPSTSKNDKIRKKRQYERFGVKEFWIADPTHRTIDQFILQNGTYNLHNTFGDTDILTSPLFSCVSIDLAKVFPEKKSKK